MRGSIPLGGEPGGGDSSREPGKSGLVARFAVAAARVAKCAAAAQAWGARVHALAAGLQDARVLAEETVAHLLHAG